MTPRLLILAGFALLAGCVAQPVSKPAAPVVTPKPAPIVNGQTEKDATVVGAADRIDGIVQGEAVAAPVRVETDTIRAAVAANPASDVKALAAQFEEAIKLLREQLAASDKRAKQLDAQIESLRDAEMKAQALEAVGGAPWDPTEITITHSAALTEGAKVGSASSSGTP